MYFILIEFSSFKTQKPITVPLLSFTQFAAFTRLEEFPLADITIYLPPKMNFELIYKYVLIANVIDMAVSTELLSTSEKI